MDEWVWDQLQPWVDARATLPVGPLFCVVTGPTCDARGRTPPYAPNRKTLPHGPACVAASPRTSCVTRMPWRWLERAYR